MLCMLGVMRFGDLQLMLDHTCSDYGHSGGLLDPRWRRALGVSWGSSGEIWQSPGEIWRPVPDNSGGLL